MERTTKAIERITFAIVNDSLDIITMFIGAFVYVVKCQCVWVEDKILSYRTKRGYRIDQFEEKIEDWQYECMAYQLKFTTWERGKLDRLGESLVLDPENFPNLSRRQARKVMDTWRILYAVKKKPRKYIRKRLAQV